VGSVALETSLTDRYGKGIIDDINALSQRPELTLQYVADRHGLSKEGVRLIFNKYHKMTYTETLKQFARDKQHERHLDMTDPYRRMQRYKDPAGRGIITHAIVYQKCIDRGFDVDSQLQGAPFDLLVNGHKVEVKGVFSSNNKRYYSTQLWPSELETAEIVVVFVHPTETLYIFPLKIVGIAGSIYIRKSPSKHHAAKNKYMDYIDAWHLLDCTR